MAFQLGEMIWRISADAKQFIATLDGVDKKADKTAKGFANIGDMIKTGFAVVAGSAVLRFAKSMVKAASDAEETQQKFEVVFSAIGKDAETAAAALAANFNMSGKAAKEVLSATGNILQSMGYSQKAALDSSVILAQLGADITSFSNYAGGAEQATQILTKAMLGERDALQALDIKISDMDLQAYADAQGKIYEKLTQREKAEMTMALILERTKLAQGDVARSINSTANQMRTLDNAIQDMSVSMGQAMIPSVREVSAELIGLNKSSAGGAGVVSGYLAAVTATIAEPIKLLIRGITTVSGLMSGLFGDSKDGFGSMIEMAGKFGKAMFYIATPIGWVLTIFKGLRIAVNEFGNQLGLVSGAAFEVGKQVLNFASKLTGIELPAPFLKAITWAEEKISSISDKLGSFSKKGSFEITGQTDLSDSQQAAEEAQRGIINRRDKVVAHHKATQAEIDKAEKAAEDRLQKKIDLEKENTDAVEKYKNAINEASKAPGWEGIANSLQLWSQYNPSQMLQAFTSNMNLASSQIMNIMSAVDQYQKAVTQSKLDDLDIEMQKELEAAGVAEASAISQAETDLNTAIASGDAKNIALAQQALKKAQIEDKYAKKKAQTEYEGAHKAWEMQKILTVAQGAMAVLNAYSSAAAIPYVGWILAPIAAGVAAGVAGLQYATVSASEPKPPQLANGGIIKPSREGTNIIAGENNKPEAILNQSQMQRLLDIADGKVGAAGGQIVLNNYIGGDQFENILFKKTDSGEWTVSKRGVV